MSAWKNSKHPQKALILRIMYEVIFAQWHYPVSGHSSRSWRDLCFTARGKVLCSELWQTWRLSDAWVFWMYVAVAWGVKSKTKKMRYEAEQNFFNVGGCKWQNTITWTLRTLKRWTSAKGTSCVQGYRTGWCWTKEFALREEFRRAREAEASTHAMCPSHNVDFTRPSGTSATRNAVDCSRAALIQIDLIPIKSACNVVLSLRSELKIILSSSGLPDLARVNSTWSSPPRTNPGQLLLFWNISFWRKWNFRCYTAAMNFSELSIFLKIRISCNVWLGFFGSKSDSSFQHSRVTPEQSELSRIDCSGDFEACNV